MSERGCKTPLQHRTSPLLLLSRPRLAAGGVRLWPGRRARRRCRWSCARASNGRGDGSRNSADGDEAGHDVRVIVASLARPLVTRCRPGSSSRNVSSRRYRCSCARASDGRGDGSRNSADGDEAGHHVRVIVESLARPVFTSSLQPQNQRRRGAQSVQEHDPPQAPAHAPPPPPLPPVVGDARTG